MSGKNVVIFEDSAASDFNPLALTRPVFEFICGMTMLWRSIVDRFYSDAEVYFICRDYLKDTFQRDYPNRVNDSITLETFRSLGAELMPVLLPDSIPVRALSIILWAETSAAFDELTRSNRDDELVLQKKEAWPNYFRQARFIPATEYIQANRLRYLLIEELHSLFSQYDVIISSSFGGNQLLITNLTGHPCVVMPNGFDEKGHPTSISLLGNLFDEATILAVAKAYQDATEWDDQHPELFK